MKAKTILINLIVVVVILVAIELVCRQVLTVIYDRGFDSKMIQDRKYYETDGLKENTQGMVWHKLYHITDVASRATGVPNKPGKKKRLFIGDSVTAGVGVEDTSTFTALFAKADSLNVYNYSLIGYATPSYYDLLRYYVGKDSAIAQAHVFFCLNDVYGRAVSKELPDIAKQNFKSWLNEVLSNKYATYKVLKLLVYTNTNNYFRYDLQFYNNDNPRFQQSMAYLNSCDSLCKANNINFQITIVPYRSQLQGKDENNRVPQTLVKEYCHSKGIAISDPIDHLKAQNDHKGLYLLADEIHLSEKGHRAVADYLLSR